MATVTVAILGMGRLGASVALALKRYNERKDAQHSFEVTLAEMQAGIREDATKIGLGKQIERDLFSAARGKDIVVLALPYAETQSAYKEIGPELRPGTVLLDAAPLKLPSLEWAKKHLKPETHLVGITPILNPKYLFDGLDDTQHAQADLFDKGSMLLMPSASCIKDAVELASDFSTLLGATPHFFDPAEHDSLSAATEGVPALLSLAVFYANMQSAGWSDSQRITNPAFGRLTRHLHDTHPDDLRDLLLNNREATLRQLDNLLTTLTSFRTVLAQNDRSALEAALSESSEAYSGWINRRHNAKWDEEPEAEKTPGFGSMMMGGLMGGFLSKRLGGKNGDAKNS